jgi:hypothetical protein
VIAFVLVACSAPYQDDLRAAVGKAATLHRL